MKRLREGGAKRMAIKTESQTKHVLVKLNIKEFMIIIDAIRSGDYVDIDDFVNKAVEEKLTKFRKHQ